MVRAFRRALADHAEWWSREELTARPTYLECRTAVARYMPEIAKLYETLCEAIMTHALVATNHQERVEWRSHARFAATVERERYLLQRLTLHP